LIRGPRRSCGIVLGVLAVAGGGAACNAIDGFETITTTEASDRAVSDCRDGDVPRGVPVDLLLDVDNSASMGDKEAYLALVVPDLVTRLVQPNCVSSAGAPAGRSKNGCCAAYPGTTLEFPPVRDMHIGIVSSSLGTRGVTTSGAVCEPTSMTNDGAPFGNGDPAISSHADDRGELIDRTATDPYREGTSADAGGQHFLDWFPTGPGWATEDGGPATGPLSPVLAPLATPIRTPAQLEKDFSALIIGAHYYGCGIESQLESWYRFLVQPDPYDSIQIVGDNAQWTGVDATIIKQRHDFLRPDSVVAILVLSDENDSEIDVRSFEGQGYKFMDENFPPPRGTSTCATSPGSPSCTTCAYCRGTKPASICDDPICKTGTPYFGSTDPGFYINVRHVHMQEKYGLDVQFPLGRYLLGLTSLTVPDRNHEHPTGATQYLHCYQGGIGQPSCEPTTMLHTEDLDCTNPLFAATLPDGSDPSATTLCNASGGGGPRTSDLVFYAHIGGIPHQLLQVDPKDPDSPQKDTLSPSDWVKILGNGWESLPNPPALTNPNQYDYGGIDVHMVEAFAPRPPPAKALTLGPFASGGGLDPINGGEWVTNTASPQHTLPVDREYACIFALVDPKTGDSTPRDCTNPDYAIQDACDCSVENLPLDAVPSVCGLHDQNRAYAAGVNDYTTQYFAKAYPTIREIELARLMGNQGVLSSLCPIHVMDNATGDDPLFGYRPAVNALVTRMKEKLAAR
jgi:hypothetical protein